MYDFKNCGQFYENFKYWFIPDGDVIEVYLKPVGGGEKIHVQSSTILELDSSLDSDMHTDWEAFKLRPEFSIVKLIMDEHSIIKDRDFYEELLTGVCMMRAIDDFKHDPDKGWPRIQKCLEWLSSTDFYTAPASTQYHDSFPGGLCQHHIVTAYFAAKLHRSNLFEYRGGHPAKSKLEDVLLVALVHDWCKIGMYEAYTRNVKNEQTGVWEKVPSFRVRDTRMSCLGHGVSSMYIAQRFFMLSHEEALAIRWHQGRWNVCREEMNELQYANERYPMVHLLQFADQLSITNYANM